jgi:hypothetical protein
MAELGDRSSTARQSIEHARGVQRQPHGRGTALASQPFVLFPKPSALLARCLEFRLQVVNVGLSVFV